MLVYGDVESTEKAGDKQAAIEACLVKATRLLPGIERHAALVEAFIGASELVQGILDAEFEERGFDSRSETHALGMECLTLLASSIEQSWRSGFMRCLSPIPCLELLFSFDPSLLIRTRQAEGYAFYALYPETYLESAASSGLGPRTHVIGIRSIGAGLGALVAAALGAPPPLTIRPVGHPFRREVRVDPALTEQFAADREAAFAIVDEGPGLSGSSFGAVADWLETAGIARERIHFFPSHDGHLGPQASQSHRERWRMAARHTASMDHLLLHSAPPHSLAAWIEESVGPLEHPLEDASGGEWRRRRYSREDDWPAANIQQERRKFLTQASGSSWLVKFGGLGETGMRKFQRAKELHLAGFTPEVAGYHHGFLVERWHEDACTLDQTGFDRGQLVQQVGAYLGFRARHFPSADGRGASLSKLRHMALHNTRQMLGEAAVAALELRMLQADSLESKLRRVDTDNRMHAWEWLVRGDRLVKTDALDHSAAHDLIGCQDIGWDIAGAKVELDLSDEEADLLRRIVQHESGHAVAPEVVSVLEPCYLAFQIGAHAMAADALGGGQETERLRRSIVRYAARLLERLGLS